MTSICPQANAHFEARLADVSTRPPRESALEMERFIRLKVVWGLL
jgi:hypothetical protein